MKAMIKADGALLVLPENEIEAYALSCWWKAYMGDSDHRPVFGIVPLDDALKMNESEA